jgi:uncharacterized membrane protein
MTFCAMFISLSRTYIGIENTNWGGSESSAKHLNLFVTTGLSSFGFLELLALAENAVSFFGVWIGL